MIQDRVEPDGGKVDITGSGWTIDVLDRLDPDGLVRALDAGCGSGALTEQLLRRFPAARVVALDCDEAALDEAAERLEPWAERVGLLEHDLNEPLPLSIPRDAIVSVDTFHWVPDHLQLFEHLSDALVPGGQLVFACGGAGNLASVLRGIADLLPDAQSPWTFPTAAETSRNLQLTGFEVVDITVDELLVPMARPQFRPYLAGTVLPSYLAQTDPLDRPALVDAIANRLGDATLDFVRLDVTARRR